MARVLVLREPEDARHTAALLAARGHEAIALPLQEMRPLEPDPPAGPFAGFLVTSAHAAPWLAHHNAGSPRPVLAVGARTADRLRQAGFSNVDAGAGTAEDLVPLAAALANPEGRPFLYAAGRTRLPALESGLTERGVPLVVAEVYEMIDRRIGIGELTLALSGLAPDAVLILSRRQAELFARLAETHPALLPAGMAHLCLSRAVCDRLPASRREQARVALRPYLSTLLDLLV